MPPHTHKKRIYVAALLGLWCLFGSVAVFRRTETKANREPAATGQAHSVGQTMVDVDPGRQTKVHVPHNDGTYSYWVYAPQQFSANSQWPLLLVLHGAGESGSDLDSMIAEGATGLPFVTLNNGRKPDSVSSLFDKFIVVSPQTNRGWDGDDVAAFVGELEQLYPIDPTRRYVTGVSMGGGGTWVAAATGLFAAAAPVCGTVRLNPDSIPKHVAIWAFHGANDVVVPVWITDENIEKLQQFREASESAAPVEYTRFDTSPAPVGWDSYTGHASWIQAYGGEQGESLFNWFLKYALSE